MLSSLCSRLPTILARGVPSHLTLPKYRQRLGWAKLVGSIWLVQLRDAARTMSVDNRDSVQSTVTSLLLSASLVLGPRRITDDNAFLGPYSTSAPFEAFRMSGGAGSRLCMYWSTVANRRPSSNEPATNHRSHGVTAIATTHAITVMAPPRVPKIPSFFSVSLDRLRRWRCFRNVRFILSRTVRFVKCTIHHLYGIIQEIQLEVPDQRRAEEVGSPYHGSYYE
jgi:hypothetical protein